MSAEEGCTRSGSNFGSVHTAGTTEVPWYLAAERNQEGKRYQQRTGITSAPLRLRVCFGLSVWVARRLKRFQGSTPDLLTPTKPLHTGKTGVW